ncbi:hypothetical protein L598_001500000030 [Mesorhizobium sp. J18]|nr:hypothetical protein L598_001500000030 [Mesorhizobium sp. J18]
MRLFRRLDFRPEERLQGDGEAEREHQCVADDGDERQQRRPAAAQAKAGIDLFLGEEAEEWRQPAHRRGGEDRCGECDRHRLAQPAHHADVAAPGLMVDQAGDHEERALEHGMGDQVEHRRLDRDFRAESGQHDQEAQRGDRGIGKHQLEIGLADAEQRADEKRRPAEDRQDRFPERRIAHHRVQPHDQIDAGLHHGRRMQVGRNGCRRLHGIGKPEMERELRRLGEGAAEHEQKRRQIERAFAQCAADLHQFRKRVGACRCPDDQQPGEQGQAADTRDHQRLKGRPARGFALMVEADQQEGGDRSQFPEDEEHQEGIGNNEPLHRPHEHEDEGEEAPLVFMAFEIAAGIENDQCSDARDQQGECQRQAVEIPGEVDAEARYPFIAAGHRIASRNGRQETAEIKEDEKRHDGQQPGRLVLQHPCEKRRGGGCDKGKDEQQEYQELPLFRHLRLVPLILPGFSSLGTRNRRSTPRGQGGCDNRP